MWRILVIVGVAYLITISTAQAEIKNASPEELNERATNIVEGKVVRIYTATEKRDNLKYTHLVAAISVSSVDKGKGIEKGELVYVRYWRSKWLGDGPPSPGHYGHRGVPDSGDNVRVYLNKAADGGYDVLSPNGFKVLGK